MLTLGIETSCDETSAAVLENGVVKSNVISSQLVHQKFGGVVPELASRAHQRMIIEVVEEALQRAGVTKYQLNGIAATQGPGLVGALLVGLNFAKAMAYGLNIPFVGVNHMEGHLYSVFLEEKKPSYPFISLIVSGGHTMLVFVEAPFIHTILGQTRDDAAGEAFDKVAKMLGIGYPGGPIIDKLAASGNPNAIKFPRTFLEEGTFDFSFSGVKTAVLYYLKNNNLLTAPSVQNSSPLAPSSTPLAPNSTLSAPSSSLSAHSSTLLADICASFQDAVVDVLVEKTLRAAEEMNVSDVAIAGGVSANSRLRNRMKEECEQRNMKFIYPKLEYCMDNGAMIGYVGAMKLQRGIVSPFEIPAIANMELV